MGRVASISFGDGLGNRSIGQRGPLVDNDYKGGNLQSEFIVNLQRGRK